MFQFENIETPALIKMLARYTEKFTQVFRRQKDINPSKGYLRCKYTIEAILRTLKKRNVASETEALLERYEAVCFRV